MIHLSAAQIQECISPSEVILAVRAGLISESKGDYFIPQRMHIDQDNDTHLLMPAFGKKYNCTKLVSVIPDNKQRGLPIINGTVILNDATTGTPLALMDAPMITALRTAAVGAIGMDIIAPKEIDAIGIIGCGFQGIWQTIYATAVRDFKNVYCYSRSGNKYAHYLDDVLSKCPDLDITICKSPEDVVQASDVVYACTNSVAPVFENRNSLVSGKKFISVGSFKKDMQELPDLVYQQADYLMLDADAARNEVGDVINTIDNGWIPHDKIFTLGDLLSGKFELDTKVNVVFKSVGMAAFDLALASALYEKSSSR